MNVRLRTCNTCVCNSYLVVCLSTEYIMCVHNIYGRIILCKLNWSSPVCLSTIHSDVTSVHMRYSVML